MISTPSSILLAVTICVLLASNRVDGSWEECKTTKLVLKNNWMSNNLAVISSSRLPAGQNTQDCLARCRANQECYSFNYNKLAKWCYLGTTEEIDLKQSKNSKWAAGFRRCIEQINDSGWSNGEYFGGDDTAPPSPPPAPPPPPSAPSVPLTAAFTLKTGVYGAIDASWTAPTSDGGLTVRYTIQCTPTSGSTVTVTGISTTSYTLTGIAPGTYSCAVKATNAAGSSVYTTAVTGLLIPGVPSVPLNVANTFNTGASSVVMTWTVPSTDNGSPITGYDLKCTNTINYADSVILGVTTTACTGSTCTTTVTGLTSLSTAIYTCGVKATNSIGSSASAYAPCTGNATPGTCNGVSVCTVDNFNNCGSCGNTCYIGTETCANFKCQCLDGTLTFQATSAPCGASVSGSAGNQARLFTVTSSKTATFSFDAVSVPDRFVIKQGSVCGATIFDSGFRGQVSAGCLQSAPCCSTTYFPGATQCTGTAGTSCPSGTGAGSTSFAVTPGTYYVLSYGVCTSTGYSYTFNC